MSGVHEERKIETLPLLPLRGMVAYPDMMLRVDVGRPKSLTALDSAMHADQRVVMVAQKDAAVDEPCRDDLYGMGAIVRVKQVVKVQDDVLRLLVQGENRALLVRLIDQPDMQKAEVEVVPTVDAREDLDTVAHMRVVKALYREYAAMRGISGETPQAILGMDNPGALPDEIAGSAPFSVEDRQAILECRAPLLRNQQMIALLTREMALAKLEEKIQGKVREGIDRHQKEYFLREQLHAIHEELGDAEELEADRLRARLDASPISGEAREKVEEELRRFDGMAQNGPEAAVSRNYIETMLDLPWGKYSRAAIRIERARRILDEDHFGLVKVKERILEFLAVRAMNGQTKSPILCLVGPPGVGKTSIARSIARATGREFVRMSLGGLHDEAEIRGHRRTYLGAIPGRIVSQIKTAGVMNPLFLLDEIDKMASDFRGDPASAMLEVLDPEQNATFSDHYLEAPFDLSGVMFVTTANAADQIPRPLLDRMELIEVPGYSLEEKTQIAKRHLWPKQLKEHGFTRAQLRIGEPAIREIIDGYTRESGVRELERELGAVCRKSAVRWLETPEPERKNTSIRPEQVKEMLGARKYEHMDTLKQPEVGVVNGLAWTPFGGETLAVEVAVMPGAGAVELTGQLGDVMKESARTAYSYIRTRADSLGIHEDFHKSKDLHIHVPEGATPKDGPSAGVALTCAMVSAITGRPARQDVAMTGEITLLGRVLPIGGVKEKLLAAHRMGIDTVLLPRENEKDLEELPHEILGKMHIKLISGVDQALGSVLAPQ